MQRGAHDRGSLIRVLVVDDSAVMRQFMSGLLSREPTMSVQVAANPVIALRKMADWRPDVILLDLEMPQMDGLTFLRKIMATDPIPVVVFSSHVAKGTDSAFQALEEGAVEVMAKPGLGLRDFLRDSAAAWLDTIRAAAEARPRRRRPLLPTPQLTADEILAPRPSAVHSVPGEKIVAIGASTGGPEALRHLLDLLPLSVPGIVIVQHMTDHFIPAFAKRLDRHCRIEVRVAEDGDEVRRGRALIAPGGLHTMVVPRAGGYGIRIAGGPLVRRHRPSVDVLFRSIAQVAGPSAVGVIMTGMGDDGAAGLLEMKQAGACTLAQDEASSVVFGMPKEAIAKRAVDTVVSLAALPAVLLTRVHGPPSRSHTARR